MPSWSGSALKKRGIPFVVAGNSNCRQSLPIRLWPCSILERYDWRGADWTKPKCFSGAPCRSTRSSRWHTIILEFYTHVAASGTWPPALSRVRSPGYADAYFNLATSRASSGNPQEAVRLWEKTLELNPTHVRALESLSGFYARKGDPGRVANLVQRLQDIKKRDRR